MKRNVFKYFILLMLLFFAECSVYGRNKFDSVIKSGSYVSIGAGFNFIKHKYKLISETKPLNLNISYGYLFNINKVGWQPFLNVDYMYFRHSFHLQELKFDLFEKSSLVYTTHSKSGFLYLGVKFSRGRIGLSAAPGFGVISLRSIKAHSSVIVSNPNQDTIFYLFKDSNTVTDKFTGSIKLGLTYSITKKLSVGVSCVIIPIKMNYLYVERMVENRNTSYKEFQKDKYSFPYSSLGLSLVYNFK